MLVIIAILLIIFILDLLINRKLIKKLHIEQSDLDKEYVNKLHKYGERTLYWTSIIVLIITVSDFPQLRILVFMGITASFAFRMIMQWIYTKEDKTYFLSAVTFVLFTLGSVTYGITSYFNIL